MKRNMTTAMMALAVSTVMTAVVLGGCGGTPKETMPETAKEQETEVRTADTTRESGRDKESNAEAASGSYEDKTIKFVGMTLDNEYHITLANDARVKVEAKNARIEVQAGDQHASADAQLGIIENMIASKVDGILLVPSFSGGLEPTLTKYKEAGIPIINLDTKLTDESLTSVDLNIPFYGTNNCEGAKLVGEYVAKSFEKETRTVMLRGVEGQTNVAGRYNGFIGGTGDTVTATAEQTANWEMDQGYTAAQNIVSANPDVELFFYYNDNMGTGALRVIKEANIQEQIRIIGFDAINETSDLVENEEFLAAVAQYPAEMGKLGIDSMPKIFDGGEAGPYIDTGTEVVTKNNVDEFRDYLKTLGQEQGWGLAKDFSYGIRTYSRP